MRSGRRMNRSWLLGAHMAVNAVRDAGILVDGPDCAVEKGQLLFPRHDLLSTLIPEDGPHRIACTGVGPDDAIRDREAEIALRAREILGAGHSGILLLTSLPHCTVTGTDSARIARAVSGASAGRVVALPGGSLSGDWIDGYASTLAALASSVDLPGVARDGSAVAIVGHFMHRNEGDKTGDASEMRRLVEGLGLEVACVWPSGGPLSDLAAAARAGLIVSLPAGREAGRLLSARTGADLLETHVPIGIAGTRRWVEGVAARTGRETACRSLVDREIGRIVRRIDRLVPFCFQGREAIVVGDPTAAAGVAGLLHELGCSVPRLVVEGRAGHGWMAAPSLPHGAAPRFEPEIDDLIEDLVSAPRLPDLAVVPGEYAPHFAPRVPVVELGFPSWNRHVLDEAPDIGFRGVLGLVGRMAEAMMSRRD